MIKTKVELTNGKIVSVYYLNEDDKRKFDLNDSRISSAIHQVEILTNKSEKNSIFIYTLLYGVIIDFYREAISQLRSKFIDQSVVKSFYRRDIWRDVKIISNSVCYQAMEEAFQNLVDIGKIEDRGSGWYRFVD